ncbi:MAG: geranylgeranyl reductase family protein, partial [Chloroflexota bacterium]
MQYDVIVAGAGPAGSTAARECAARGLRTLMLDKAEFPRDKPCGGGVNLRASRLLPFDLEPVIERPIFGMRISVRQRSSFTRRATEPITVLTQRRRLDAYLAERAVHAGVEFCQRSAVRSVERRAGKVLVRSGSASYESRALVVADGANGPVAGLADIAVARRKEIALEGNITPSDRYPSEWLDVFGIDVGSAPGGYGWLFPKGDHVNVGIGGWSSVGPTLRPRLDQLARYYGFAPSAFWGVRGHPLPVRQAGATLVDENILLTGDAAG